VPLECFEEAFACELDAAGERFGLGHLVDVFQGQIEIVHCLEQFLDQATELEVDPAIHVAVQARPELLLIFLEPLEGLDVLLQLVLGRLGALAILVDHRRGAWRGFPRRLLVAVDPAAAILESKGVILLFAVLVAVRCRVDRFVAIADLDLPLLVFGVRLSVHEFVAPLLS